MCLVFSLCLLFAFRLTFFKYVFILLQLLVHATATVIWLCGSFNYICDGCYPWQNCVWVYAYDTVSMQNKKNCNEKSNQLKWPIVQIKFFESYKAAAFLCVSDFCTVYYSLPLSLFLILTLFSLRTTVRKTHSPELLLLPYVNYSAPKRCICVYMCN